MNSKLQRPQSVPVQVAEAVWEAGSNPQPEILDPDLLDASGSEARDFTRLPAEVIQAHGSNLYDQGATEEQEEADIRYLLDLFEEAVAARKEKRP
jgi:hypothetical protein